MPTYEMSEEEREHRQRMLEHAQNYNNTSTPISSSTYSCPVCWEDVPIPDYIKYGPIKCYGCDTRLRIERDADFHDGMWHDLTRLIPIDDDEHPA
jgi:hypothetical protein